MLRRVPHNRFCGIYKRFSFLSAFHVFSSSTKHPGNDAVLAEHVYSQGVAHTHTLDNPNTFCAIPSRPASYPTPKAISFPTAHGAVVAESYKWTFSLNSLETRELLTF